MSVILGIIILVVDALWIYGSLPHYHAFAGAYPGNSSVTSANFTTSQSFRGAERLGYINIIYGAIILVVDIVWIFLSFGYNQNPKKK